MRSHIAQFDTAHTPVVITRRRLFGVAFITGISASLPFLAGCGGGSGNDDYSGDNYPEVHTGSSGGTFDGSVIGPSAGSTYISTDTIFQISWPFATLPPPATFSVSLIRYKEARGSAGRDVGPQKIAVTKVGSTTWNIARKDGFSLDGDGVYYLQITSPGLPNQLAAYIVAGGRSEPIPAGRAVTTGQNGSLIGLEITPAPGTVFLPKHTAFTVKWPSGNTPPSTFDVNLIRYAEARGGDDRSVTTQKIDITGVGNNTWTVARQDNFDLDVGGVYYLEVLSAGSTPVRSAYIVSLEQ